MAPHHPPDADSSETAPASDQPAHAQEPAREQETDEPRTAYERRGGPVQQRAIRIIGPVASVMAIAMFVSYIPQIMNNLDGHKTNPLQPFVTMINCTLWTIYGLWRPKRDWPIAVANMPGILFGALAAVPGL